MKFGRLNNLRDIDFSLPDDHKSNVSFSKENVNKSTKKKLILGCPVWADKGFIGKIYPPKTSTKVFLNYYCQHFDAIELNATHYKIPSLDTVQRWKEQVSSNKHFKFCPKVPQIISHSEKLTDNQTILDDFLESISNFHQFLGVTFVQLPEFKLHMPETIYYFLEALPDDLNFAIELRHPTYFKDQKLRDEVFSIFYDLGVSAILTDVAGKRYVLHQQLTTDYVFIRFTGNNLHTTDYTRINNWIDRLVYWFDLGINTIYFFLHEPEKSLCVDLALYFIEKWAEKSSIPIKTPVLYQEKQKKLF